MTAMFPNERTLFYGNDRVTGLWIAIVGKSPRAIVHEFNRVTSSRGFSKRGSVIEKIRPLKGNPDCENVFPEILQLYDLPGR